MTSKQGPRRGLEPPVVVALACRVVLALALVPAVSSAITLDRCLELARRNAPGLQAAAADVSRAEEAVRAARAALHPSLRLGASLSQANEAPKAVFDIPGGAGRQVLRLGSATTLSVKTEAQYNIYSGGRTAALVRAASADAQQESSAREQAAADLVQRVSQAYYRELTAGRLLAAADEALATAQSHLAIARARVNAGVVPKLEVLRSEVDASKRQIAVVRALEAQRMARVELETAIGVALAPGDSLDELAQPAAIEADSSRAMASALEARPEIAAVQRQIAATFERVDATRAERRPRVDLMGTAEYRAPNRFENYANFSDEGLKTYNLSAGVAMTMPLLDGGAVDARAGELRAQRAALEARRRGLVLEVRREVQHALSDLRVATAVWSSNEARISSAREALRLANAAYKEGTATGTDVRDAATALADARGEEAESLRDYWFARTELDHATGANVTRKED